MKKVARILAAVALAALSVLPAAAQAHAPNQDRSVQPVSRPTHQTAAQRTLARILAREHHTYPTPGDPQAQAAQRTLARTLAREYHTYLAAGDSPQPANPRRAAQRSILSTLTVLAMTTVVAMTWRRRARSRFRAAR